MEHLHKLNPIWILIMQGFCFILMGAYFWYDWKITSNENGIGPFILSVGILEVIGSIWLYHATNP